MKNKVIFIGVLVSTILIVAAAPERSSSGAPGGHTGAPDEQTCAASGCHDDNSVNSGAAVLSLELGKTITSFTPGQTYTIKVKIAETGVDRFGFQLLALDNATQKSVGSFQVTDMGRTQVATTQLFPDREYLTYTFNGTDATANSSEWIVNWTAPTTATTSVSFYAAAVSADDDMTDKGDHVYTTSKMLNRLITPTTK